MREQLTSYAQRRLLLGEILRQMQEKLGDLDFAKNRVKAVEPLAQRLVYFERRLAEVVAEKLGIVTISDLRQKASDGIWKTVSERWEIIKKSNNDLPIHQAFTLGQTKEIIERRDNVKLLMPLFTDPVNGFGDDQAVIAGLTGITRARNAIDHGRRLGNRRLLIAYLETFERLIGS